MPQELYKQFRNQVATLTYDQQIDLLSVLLERVDANCDFSMSDKAASELFEYFTGKIQGQNFCVRNEMNSYLDERYGL